MQHGDNFSAGAATVGTVMQTLAETLRLQSIALRAGASLIEIKGNASVPKIATGATATWLTEIGQLSESALTFGAAMLTGHRLSCLLSVSSQLLAQSPQLAEFGLRRELPSAIGYALDVGVFSGIGASGEPIGLLNVSGFSTVTFSATATRAKLALFERTLGDNFAEGGALAWVSSPATREKLRVTDGLASGGIPLWSDENEIISYPALCDSRNRFEQSRRVWEISAISWSCSSAKWKCKSIPTRARKPPQPNCKFPCSVMSRRSGTAS